jgi:2-polyprenyl-3-methyl-5-hydroxy-6-metoxy-1,4-benzoquinol methylase
MILEDLLVDPESKQKLRLNRETGEILYLNAQKFNGKIEGKIPVILPKLIESEFRDSELHKQQNTTFDYVDHYQKDAQFFDYFQEIESKVIRDERERLNQKIITLIPQTAEKILDVGCGNGWLSKTVQKDSNHIISLDISLINTRKALINQPHPNHSAIVADVFHLPFVSESIDVIVASEIIEHISQPEEFVKHLLYPLRKGGKLIITTPYNEVITQSLCIHCNKPTPNNAHLHSFDENKISKLIPYTVQNWNYSLMINKLFLKMRIYSVLRKIPFHLWYKLDRLANRISKNPTRMVIEIIK